MLTLAPAPSTSTDTLRLLLELGYVATNRGLHTQAQTIANALAALRPQSPYPHLLQALIHLNQHQPLDAVHCLRSQALPLAPEDTTIKAFLALALRLGGHRGESGNILGEILVTGTDETALTMAQHFIRE